MKEYIKNLRSKPEHIRKQYLIGAMIVSMSLVCGVWIYGLTSHFSNSNTPEKMKADIEPLSLLGQGLSSGFKDISASAADAVKTPDEKNAEKMIPLITVEKNNQ